MMDPLQLLKGKAMERKKADNQSKSSYQSFLIYLGQISPEERRSCQKRLPGLCCGLEVFLFDGRKQIFTE